MTATGTHNGRALGAGSEPREYEPMECESMIELDGMWFTEAEASAYRAQNYPRLVTSGLPRHLKLGGDQ